VTCFSLSHPKVSHLAQRRGSDALGHGTLGLPPAEFCSWLEGWAGGPISSLGVAVIASALPAAVGALRHAVHATAELEVPE